MTLGTVSSRSTGLEGAVAEAKDDDSDSVESEADLAVRVGSRTSDGLGGDAGVSRSVSPREPIEEAELDTLPVEVRFDRDRREKAAADEAVDVREDAGAPTDLVCVTEVESGRAKPDDAELVLWSPSELRRSDPPAIAKLDGTSEAVNLSSSSSPSS